MKRACGMLLVLLLGCSAEPDPAPERGPPGAAPQDAHDDPGTTGAAPPSRPIERRQVRVRDLARTPGDEQHPAPVETDDQDALAKSEADAAALEAHRREEEDARRELLTLRRGEQDQREVQAERLLERHLDASAEDAARARRASAASAATDREARVSAALERARAAARGEDATHAPTSTAVIRAADALDDDAAARARDARARATDAREAAGRARRFAKVTTERGIAVPGARVDAERRAAEADDREVEAGAAESEADVAHEAAHRAREIER